MRGVGNRAHIQYGKLKWWTYHQMSVKVPQKHEKWSFAVTQLLKDIYQLTSIPYKKRWLHFHVHCSSNHNTKKREWCSCSSSDEWFMKLWYAYTMEVYVVVKKDEIMRFGGMWMYLENLLSEECKVHKMSHVFPYIYRSWLQI